jgi:hypothetical protein
MLLEKVMRVVELGVFGIKLCIRQSADGKEIGDVISELQDYCPHCGQPYCYFGCDESQIEDSQESEDEALSRIESNAANDGIVSMILGHAIAGIDVESPAYKEGIETAVEAAGNNL